MLHTYIYHLTELHITYRPDIRTNCDVNQLFPLQLYAKYLVKMFRDQTEVTSLRPGTVPVPFWYYL